MSAPRLRPATATDLAAVASILEGAELPPDGLRDQFPAAYAVAELDGAIIGAAGLERYGNAGLLRSVVVIPAWRGRRVAETLIRERLQQAAAAGVTEVYALTTTAAGYFPRLGFAPADRAAAPASIQGSPQFASICPSSAAFLSLNLDGVPLGDGDGSG
jgi:amino-acid N-acetyltransferase